MKNKGCNLVVTSTNLNDNTVSKEYLGKALLNDKTIRYKEKKEPYAEVEVLFNINNIVIKRVMDNYELELCLKINEDSFAKVITGNKEMIISINVYDIIVIDNYIKVNYAIVDGDNVIEHFIKEFKYKEEKYE